jgi:thiol-disulfide isomerase/thioredoxin
MESLRGNVVLIDFGTYTCVNCIRTLPYLKDWYSKYAVEGLVIVGVHSPEFEFEKLTENVARSVSDFELEYPIAQDNDFGTWRAYSNRFWPAKYLADQDGTVRYAHFGEGAYDETEEHIRNLLEETGADLSGVAVNDIPPPETDPKSRTADRALGITREIYGGYLRNASSQGVYVADPVYYDEPERVFEYHDNGFHQNQFIYLQGLWFNGLEELRHARQTKDYEDHIALKFFATSVNAVINFEGQAPFEVNVTIDGRPLRPKEAGTDLVTRDARSFFTVNQARLYEVVALPEFGGHELTLSSNSPDFAFFAFTFGAYTEGL